MKRFAIILLSIVVAITASVGVDAKVRKNRGNKAVSTQNVKRAYIKKVKSLLYYGDEGYFLTDITGDGIPELWVKYGTCEADYILDVYTYTSSGLKRILHTSAGHTGYFGYPNGDYVIALWAHMGTESHVRLTYSGNKLHEKVIYESPGEVEEYKTLDEPFFETIPFSKYNLINSENFQDRNA